MSLASLAAAAQYAVKMSEEATIAVEEAASAAKLATVQARAALAAAEYAIDIEKQLKLKGTEKTKNLSHINTPLKSGNAGETLIRIKKQLSNKRSRNS